MSHFFFKAFIHAFIEIEPNNQQKLSEKEKKKKNNPKPHTCGSLLLTKSLISKE